MTRRIRTAAALFAWRPTPRLLLVSDILFPDMARFRASLRVHDPNRIYVPSNLS